MAPPSIRPAIKELERAFKELAFLFNQKMPLPVITIQSRGRRSASDGWFQDGTWHNGKPQGLPEINICAERLNRPLEQIAETLLHEMCHYANALESIRDCAGTYHNRKFKERCALIGLRCKRSETTGRGWSATSLSPSLGQTVRGVQLKPDAFRLFRERAALPKSVTRLKPWTCACGTRIWAAVGVDLTCNQCETTLRPAAQRGTVRSGQKGRSGGAFESKERLGYRGSTEATARG